MSSALRVDWLPPNFEFPDGSAGPEGTDPEGNDSSLFTSSGSSVSRVQDQLSPVLFNLFGMADKNTAFDAEQAAKLRDWQSQQNKIAMDFSAEQAAKNRDWQKMMSDTAHQREVQDLMKAGLNPVLSASGGNGAAVTSGATAHGVTSSGAMSQSDKTATSAMASLFGNVFSAFMNQQNAINSALTNLSIAEKNNSTSKQIADMQINSQKEIAKLQSDTQKYIADIGRLNTMTSSETQKYCAGLSASASKLAAEIHAAASMFGSKEAAAASRYASNLANSASRYATDQNNKNKTQLQEDAQKFEEFMSANYPNTIAGFGNSVATGVGNLLTGLFTGNYGFDSAGGPFGKMWSPN